MGPLHWERGVLSTVPLGKSLYDSNSLKKILMAQHVVCLGIYSVGTLKECVFCGWWVQCSINVN